MDASVRLALFDLIAEIGKLKSIRSTSLSDSLGLSFREDRAASHRYFRMYRAHGPAKPPVGATITDAELREGVEMTRDGSIGGLLILAINRKLCLSQEEVRKQFGYTAELIPPSPHGPSSAPLYLAYQKDAYKLSFGFLRNEPSCLVSVIFDALPDS